MAMETSKCMTAYVKDVPLLTGFTPHLHYVTNVTESVVTGRLEVAHEAESAGFPCRCRQAGLP
jgi:hypothetical protein